MNESISIYYFFSLKDIEQVEQCLLNLYSEKFHQQEELEYKQLNEVRSSLNQIKFFLLGFFSFIKN